MTFEFMPNFTLDEVACNCGCGLIIIQRELIEVLHEVRIEYGAPIYVTSWVRCWKYNKRVGGVPYSYHRFGKAIDIRPAAGVISQRFIRLCVASFPYVLVESNHLHCDLRGARRV